MKIKKSTVCRLVIGILALTFVGSGVLGATKSSKYYYDVQIESFKNKENLTGTLQFGKKKFKLFGKVINSKTDGDKSSLRIKWTKIKSFGTSNNKTNKITFALYTETEDDDNLQGKDVTIVARSSSIEKYFKRKYAIKKLPPSTKKDKKEDDEESEEEKDDTDPKTTTKDDKKEVDTAGVGVTLPKTNGIANARGVPTGGNSITPISAVPTLGTLNLENSAEEASSIEDCSTEYDLTNKFAYKRTKTVLNGAESDCKRTGETAIIKFEENSACPAYVTFYDNVFTKKGDYIVNFPDQKEYYKICQESEQRYVYNSAIVFGHASCGTPKITGNIATLKAKEITRIDGKEYTISDCQETKDYTIEPDLGSYSICKDTVNISKSTILLNGFVSVNNARLQVATCSIEKTVRNDLFEDDVSCLGTLIYANNRATIKDSVIEYISGDRIVLSKCNVDRQLPVNISTNINLNCLNTLNINDKGEATLRYDKYVTYAGQKQIVDQCSVEKQVTYRVDETDASCLSNLVDNNKSSVQIKTSLTSLSNGKDISLLSCGFAKNYPTYPDYTSVDSCLNTLTTNTIKLKRSYTYNNKQSNVRSVCDGEPTAITIRPDSSSIESCKATYNALNNTIRLNGTFQITGTTYNTPQCSNVVSVEALYTGAENCSFSISNGNDEATFQQNKVIRYGSFETVIASCSDEQPLTVSVTADLNSISECSSNASRRDDKYYIKLHGKTIVNGQSVQVSECSVETDLSNSYYSNDESCANTLAYANGKATIKDSRKVFSQGTEVLIGKCSYIKELPVVKANSFNESCLSTFQDGKIGYDKVVNYAGKEITVEACAEKVTVTTQQKENRSCLESAEVVNGKYRIRNDLITSIEGTEQTLSSCSEIKDYTISVDYSTLDSCQSTINAGRNTINLKRKVNYANSTFLISDQCDSEAVPITTLANYGSIETCIATYNANENNILLQGTYIINGVQKTLASCSIPSITTVAYRPSEQCKSDYTISTDGTKAFFKQAKFLKVGSSEFLLEQCNSDQLLELDVQANYDSVNNCLSTVELGAGNSANIQLNGRVIHNIYAQDVSSCKVETALSGAFTEETEDCASTIEYNDDGRLTVKNSLFYYDNNGVKITLSKCTVEKTAVEQTETTINSACLDTLNIVGNTVKLNFDKYTTYAGQKQIVEHCSTQRTINYKIDETDLSCLDNKVVGLDTVTVPATIYADQNGSQIVLKKCGFNKDYPLVNDYSTVNQCLNTLDVDNNTVKVKRRFMYNGEYKNSADNCTSSDLSVIPTLNVASLDRCKATYNANNDTVRLTTDYQLGREIFTGNTCSGKPVKVVPTKKLEDTCLSTKQLSGDGNSVAYLLSKYLTYQTNKVLLSACSESESYAVNIDYDSKCLHTFRKGTEQLKGLIDFGTYAMINDERIVLSSCNKATDITYHADYSNTTCYNSPNKFKKVDVDGVTRAEAKSNMATTLEGQNYVIRECDLPTNFAIIEDDFDLACKLTFRALSNTQGVLKVSEKTLIEGNLYSISQCSKEKNIDIVVDFRDVVGEDSLNGCPVNINQNTRKASWQASISSNILGEKVQITKCSYGIDNITVYAEQGSCEVETNSLTSQVKYRFNWYYDTADGQKIQVKQCITDDTDSYTFPYQYTSNGCLVQRSAVSNQVTEYRRSYYVNHEGTEIQIESCKPSGNIGIETENIVADSDLENQQINNDAFDHGAGESFRKTNYYFIDSEEQKIYLDNNEYRGTRYTHTEHLCDEDGINSDSSGFTRQKAKLGFFVSTTEGQKFIKVRDCQISDNFTISHSLQELIEYSSCSSNYENREVSCLNEQVQGYIHVFNRNDVSESKYIRVLNFKKENLRINHTYINFIGVGKNICTYLDNEDVYNSINEDVCPDIVQKKVPFESCNLRGGRRGDSETEEYLHCHTAWKWGFAFESGNIRGAGYLITISGIISYTKTYHKFTIKSHEIKYNDANFSDLIQSLKTRYQTPQIYYSN